MKKLYDPLCEHLARAFLWEGGAAPDQAEVEELAATIQEAIEDWAGSRDRILKVEIKDDAKPN